MLVMRVTQARLNHKMLINYHQDLTDKLEIQLIAGLDIDAKQLRSSIFI